MLEIGDDPKAVAVLLDLSLRHADNGIRIVDTVKSELSRWVKEFMESGIDSFYLYSSDTIDPVMQQGEMVGAIGNYETNGWLFSLNSPLSQSLYVVGACGYDLSKFVIIVTDRIQNTSAIEAAMRLSVKDRIDARFCVVGIGKQYNSNSLRAIKKDGFSYIHVDGPDQIKDALLMEFNNG